MSFEKFVHTFSRKGHKNKRKRGIWTSCGNCFFLSNKNFSHNSKIETVKTEKEEGSFMHFLRCSTSIKNCVFIKWKIICDSIFWYCNTYLHYKRIIFNEFIVESYLQTVFTSLCLYSYWYNKTWRQIIFLKIYFLTQTLKKNGLDELWHQ